MLDRQELHLGHLNDALSGLEEGVRLLDDCQTDQSGVEAHFPGLVEQISELKFAVSGFANYLTEIRLAAIK